MNQPFGEACIRRATDGSTSGVAASCGVGITLFQLPDQIAGQIPRRQIGRIDVDAEKVVAQDRLIDLLDIFDRC